MKVEEGRSGEGEERSRREIEGGRRRDKEREGKDMEL